MSLDKLLTEIRGRLTAASPYPWHTGHQNEHLNTVEIDSYTGEAVCDKVTYGKDSALIASAPTDLTKLLAIIEILREALETIDKTLRIPAAEYVPAISDVFHFIDQTKIEANKLAGE